MSKLYRFAGPPRRLWAWRHVVSQLCGREATAVQDELWADGTVHHFLTVSLSPFDVALLLPVWRAERWARHIYKEF